MIPPYVPPPELVGMQAAVAQLERENANLRARVRAMRLALLEITRMAVVSRIRVHAIAILHADRRPG